VFSLAYWLKWAINPPEYVWIKAILLKETRKAILISFDDRQIWLPRAWIKGIKGYSSGISIKISLWHWGKKAL
jgi:hypothetical protein